MKRNTLLLIVLFSLLLAALYFFFSRGPGSLGRSVRQFSIADTSLVQKVEITGKDGSVLLERHDGRWMVNGRYYARDRKMKNLLGAMLRLQPDAPAARKDREVILLQLREHSKKVTITQEGKKDKIYYAWQDSLNGGITYMILDRSDQPYRMQVPGLTAKVIWSLFSSTENAWRDNILFSLKPGRISEIEVRYISKPDASFRIEKKDRGEWVLVSLQKNKTIENFSKDNLLGYLYQFSNVRFDEILVAGTVRDNEMGEAIVMIIVKDTDGVTTVVGCYPRYIQDDKGNRVIDFNRLYLRVNDEKEILLARYIQVDLILRELNYFING